MKKKWAAILAVLLTLCMAAAAASGEQGTGPETAGPVTADVMPLPPDPDDMDPENGYFHVCLEDTDRIADEGWFTLALYRVDEYAPEQVEHLMPGTTLLVNGEKYTVAEEVTPRDIGFGDEELIVWDVMTEEECWGGLRFQKYRENTCAAYLDDWIPCTLVARLRVTIPLPDRFVLWEYPGGEDPVPCTADEFLKMLLDHEWSGYNQYNSSALLENGELVELNVAGYPHGPDSREPEDDEP